MNNEQTTDAFRMTETMNEINGTGPYALGNRKASLLKDISTLEADIESAQQVVTDSNEERTSYSTTISPEEANERRKAIVFLKKDLEKMRSEYEELK